MQVLLEGAHGLGRQGVIDVLDEELCGLLACQVVITRRRGITGWLLLHDDYTPARVREPVVPWRILTVPEVAEDSMTVWTLGGSERMQRIEVGEKIAQIT